MDETERHRIRLVVARCVICVYICKLQKRPSRRRKIEGPKHISPIKTIRLVLLVVVQTLVSFRAKGPSASPVENANR